MLKLPVMPSFFYLSRTSLGAEIPSECTSFQDITPNKRVEKYVAEQLHHQRSTDSNVRFRQLGDSFYREVVRDYWLKVDDLQCVICHTALDLDHTTLGYTQCSNEDCNAYYKITEKYLVHIELEAITEQEYQTTISLYLSFFLLDQVEHFDSFS